MSLPEHAYVNKEMKLQKKKKKKKNNNNKNKSVVLVNFSTAKHNFQNR